MSNISPDLKYLLESNSIHNTLDYLSLSRSLSDVKRCSTLPVTKIRSVSEHTLNCLFLYDFIFNHSLCSDVPTSDDMFKVRLWLQYHDISESLISDIPWTVAKRIQEYSDEVNDHLTLKFLPLLPKLCPDLLNLAKQIDMLEFLITMKTDPRRIENSSDGRRLNTCYTNAVEALRVLVISAKYRIDFHYFL